MTIRPLPSEFIKSTEIFETVVGRAEIELIDLRKIKKILSGKKILITGAGGTIGSSVARRVLQSGHQDVYFLDRDESALHALALSVSDKAASHSEKCIVGDIKDLKGLNEIFRNLRPDLVIHAAALKHLVMLERFPREGFMTNIVGTRNVLEASKEFEVSQFVNVSTDKAAFPKSFLGLTKRIGEIFTANGSDSKLTTSSVRFGNVFASRGSVIETFVHQIRQGIPVTITSEEVTRFFMSHQEAANLILSAASLNENALFIQEMGEPVSIKRVIEVLARNLGKDFSLRVIGLQNGEKLHEDLFDGEHEKTEFDTIHRVNAPRAEVNTEVFSHLLNPQSNSEATENARTIAEYLNTKLEN